MAVKHLPILALALAGPAAAAADPQPVPLPPAIPAPQDRAFPGRIELHVDATDIDRHIFTVSETVPVPPDDALTLLFPKWYPGNHGPTGPLPELAGLSVTAGGHDLTWRRDAVDVYAFHIDTPPGTHFVQVKFQFLSPVESKDGRVVTTPNMLDVQWRPEILYPAGYFARDILVHPALTLPAGWQFGTALETETSTGRELSFKPVTLNVLLDSPLYAGRYFSRIDLDPHGTVPVHLDVVADRPEDLAITPGDLQAHRNLVQQAYRNFGSHHYNHYDFLFSLSGEMDGIGLEHQRSSEDGTGRDYFTDLEKSAAGRDLLPHEFTHSWNGKFRRPADLWSPDFNIVPERDSLLWVYEGQTEYWGQVLAARSGIMTVAQVHDLLAMEVAEMQATPGRTWRNLQDTTNDPIISWHRPTAWRSWSRFGDYYVEGLLIWLDADTLIREKTNGAKSLGDFAKLFFGIDDGGWMTETYTFDDVVHTLNQVLPYDWAGFLRTRLDGHGDGHGHPGGAPIDGLTRGGWQVTYSAVPSALEKSVDSRRKSADFTYSLGLSLGGDGTVTNVLWGGPAFGAGLTRSTKVIAVNGVALEGASDLAQAITIAHDGKSPIELLLRDGNHFRNVKIDYQGGLRYPHLERIAGTPDRLDDILAPLK
jgi:predicted metalloprotease with PDZ domain